MSHYIIDIKARIDLRNALNYAKSHATFCTKRFLTHSCFEYHHCNLELNINKPMNLF